MSDLKKNYNQWHKKIYQTNLKKIDSQTWKYYKWILNLLKIKRDKKILDVSCGKGLFLKIARARGLKIYGVDISEVAIREAKRITKGKFVCGNAESLPYPNSSFNYVTCLGSLEHFENPDRGVQEIARVLKPEGRVCIYVPNLFFVGHIYFGWRYGLDPSEGGQSFSENFRSRQGWQNLLEKNGLRVTKIYKYNEVSTSQKVGKITKIMFNYFIKPFLPLNLSYSFAFICKKITGNNNKEEIKKRL